MTKIAVTGASGKLGGATIEFLLQRQVTPGDIVAVVRDPAKAVALAERGVEIRRGDYTEPESLENAFRGIDRLAFISTSALGEERLLHHGNVAKAARAANVGHIFYTSVIKPAAVAKFAASPGHFQTEAMIRDTGIAWTFFRNNLYLDLVPYMFGDAVASGQTGAQRWRGSHWVRGTARHRRGTGRRARRRRPSQPLLRHHRGDALRPG